MLAAAEPTSAALASRRSVSASATSSSAPVNAFACSTICPMPRSRIRRSIDGEAGRAVGMMVA